MGLQKAFRLVRLWLGAGLVAAWGVGWSTTDSLFFAWVASPLLLWGLPLSVSGLPGRAGRGPALGAAELVLEAVCYGIAGIYGFSSLLVVDELGAGSGAEQLFLGSFGASAVAFQSGRRVGRRRRYHGPI